MEISAELDNESNRSEPNTTGEIDALRLTLESYLRLPQSTDFRILGDDVILRTTGFPELLLEATGLSFQQYFTDVWSAVEGLDASERKRLIEDFTGIFKDVRVMTSTAAGAVLERSGKTTIKLPEILSKGIVESITFGEEIKFRLDAEPPYQASFAEVKGISFRCMGFDIELLHLALRAENGLCHIVPTLAPAPVHKSSGIMDKFKNKVVSGLLKIKSLELKVPIVMDEFKQYLANALHLKTALREHKDDLLTFLDHLSEIKIEDSFARAVFRSANQYRRMNDRIEIYRDRTTITDCGGVMLTLASELKLTLCKRVDKLQIENIEGIGVQVPFEPPKQLEKMGINLQKTMPTMVNSFAVSLFNSSTRRQVVVGIGVNRWISFLINEFLEPIWDPNGHLTIAGIASNPISENGQSFYLRLNKKFELDMSMPELMNLITNTAFEGFDPANPLTWHWGVVAAGGGSLLTVGSMLRINERTISNIKDNASALKSKVAEKSADAAAKAKAAAGKAKDAAARAKEAASKAANSAAAANAKAAFTHGAKAAADLFKKKKDE